MEKRTRARSAPYFFARAAQTNWRTRSCKTDSGLLRERLPREHRGQHFKGRWIRRTLERAGKLGSVEESETAGRRSRREMNGSTTATLPRRSFGETMRADLWWLQPLIVFLGLGSFLVYSTWAAF